MGERGHPGPPGPPGEQGLPGLAGKEGTKVSHLDVHARPHFSRGRFGTFPMTGSLLHRVLCVPASAPTRTQFRFCSMGRGAWADPPQGRMEQGLGVERPRPSAPGPVSSPALPPAVTPAPRN